jgi:hypothetical protein
MTVLIDNYSPAGHTTIVSPELAYAPYTTDSYRLSLSSIVVSFADEVGINQRIINLLEEYAQLPDHWDEDDAMAPAQAAIKQAFFLIRVLEKHGQPIFHAAPGPNGEIMLDIRNSKKTKSLEIIFYADSAVSVLFPEDGKPTQDKFDLQKLPQLLQWLNQK